MSTQRKILNWKLVWVGMVILAYNFLCECNMPALHAQESKKHLFSFVVVGCPHLTENRKGELTGVEKFEILLEQINSFQEKPDFMLIAGDIHIRGFKEVYPKIKMPVYVSFGNHESLDARKEFRKMFPDLFRKADYYSFKHKNCLFIQICDAIPIDHFGHLSSEFIFPAWGGSQCEWLEKQLVNNCNKVIHTFIFGHIPPHPQGKDQNEYLAVNDQLYLEKLIRRYKPTALFFAHLHRRLEFKIGDSEVVVVGSSNWHHDKNLPIGFMKVKVFADRIEKEFIPLETKETQKPIGISIISKGSSEWLYTEQYPAEVPPLDSNSRKWHETDYDTSKWLKGGCPFGYGDEPKVTYGTKLSNNQGNYYFRKIFEVKDTLKVSSGILKIASDNAAIVYLNGKTVDRDSLFLHDEFKTNPLGGHEFSYWNREVTLKASLFKKGKNLLAVALYNDQSSSDAYLDLELLGEDSKPEPLALLKGPYLQNLGQDKVTIMWETNIPTIGYVKYGEISCDKQEKEGEKNFSKIHEIILKNLKPATTYQYHVYSQANKVDKELGAKGFFATAPDKNRPFQFVVYGDTRTHYERHKSVIDAMLECPEGKPEFVIHSGDFVENGNEYECWGREFFGPASHLMKNIPLWPCLGNHEQNAQYYFDFFSLPNNERWYSFDYLNARFIQLDSYFSDFKPGSKQFQWLEEELNSCTKQWKFVTLHSPLFTSGPHGALGEDGTKPQEESIAYGQEFLLPLFEKYGVDMVFSGHDHAYERNKKGDIYYIVSGGGGAPNYGKSVKNPYSQVFKSTPHYCLIQINGRKLCMSVWDTQGNQIDSLQIPK
ncbi:metallophosphoesterase [bacterium]|nr:metallophosphoesterase [bacterium]